MHIHNNDYTSERIDIVNLADSVGTNGQIGLFWGTIDTDMYYFYYVETSPNTYIVEKLMASGVVICEEDIDKGYLLIEKYGLEGCGGCEYSFHVPKGTIVKQFVLDAS
jgi:hypothetical protein